MNGFEAYGFILAMVLTQPTTADALWRIVTRFCGHREGIPPSPVGSVPPCFRGGRASIEVLQKRIGSNSVRRGGKGANQ